jgi:prepilin-type N-terminal cleavage/methylation domain-containing protein
MIYIDRPSARYGTSKFHDKHGFSLIELVFTIVLIGIISAVAVAKFINLSDKAKAAVCLANQFALESAQSIYYADQLTKNSDTPHYAEKLDDLAPYMADNRIPTCPLGFKYEIQPPRRIRCGDPDHNSRP